MKKKILLAGGGDFAKKVIKLIYKIGSYDIVGYTDIRNMGFLFDVPYIGEDSEFGNIKKKFPDCSAVVAIAGNINLIYKKEKIISDLKLLRYNFPNLISPGSYIDETVVLGEGCIVFDKAYVDFETIIDSYSIINLNSTICHNTKIGKMVTISPDAITGGGSRVGNYSFLGINSTLKPYTFIGNNIIIGAGAVVTKDCIEQGIYVGNPAKLLLK